MWKSETTGRTHGKVHNEDEPIMEPSTEEPEPSNDVPVIINDVPEEPVSVPDEEPESTPVVIELDPTLQETPDEEEEAKESSQKATKIKPAALSVNELARPLNPQKKIPIANIKANNTSEPNGLTATAIPSAKIRIATARFQPYAGIPFLLIIM